MPRLNIEYQGWRVTDFRGYAHATQGSQGKKRRIKITPAVPASASVQEKKRALIAWVVRRQADELRENLTIGSIFELYVEAKRRDQKRSWRDAKSRWNALEPFFGGMCPYDLTSHMCRDYTEIRQAEGKANDTIWSELTEINSALSWAFKEQILSRQISVWRCARSKERERYLTPQEFMKLLSEVDHENAPHIETLLLLGLLTPARREAILELTWNRVDFANRMIHFNAKDMDQRDPLNKGRKKGRTSLPMGDYLHGHLRAQRDISESLYVISYEGQMIKDPKRALNSLKKRAGVLDWTLHDLRRTAATWATEMGVEVKDVRDLLAHSKNSVVTEKHYIHAGQEHLRPVVAMIEGQIAS